jgi:hypothetical protein
MDREAIKALIERAYEARRTENIEGSRLPSIQTANLRWRARKNTPQFWGQRGAIKNSEQRLQR